MCASVLVKYSVHSPGQALGQGAGLNQKISKMRFGSNSMTKLYSSILADKITAVL